MASQSTSGEPSPQAWSSLRAVLTVQTQNAFNDNVVRFTLLGIALIVLQGQTFSFWGKSIGVDTAYKNTIGILISLPFVIFAPIAGWASDRFSKRSVIQACLWAQIAIIVAIIGALFTRNIWLATGGFFVLAIQSAFFGPAKLGIMKELVGSKKLSVVSGWMQMLTIVAIVFGSPVGGAGYKKASEVIPDVWMAGLVPIGFILLMAFYALIMVRKIQPTPAHAGEKLTARVFFRHFTDLREVYRSRPVWLSSVGIAFFWFTGAFAIAVFTQIAQEAFPGNGASAGAVASYCLAATGIGIALGSVFVAVISSNRLELGLVPLGVIGMAVSLLLATFLPLGIWFYGSLVLMGATSAMFLVPQNAYLQDKADPTRRGRILSASNLINSAAAIGANVLQFGLEEGLNFSTDAQLLLLLGTCVVVAFFALRLLPSGFVRILLKIVLRFFYRIRVVGESNLPEKQGALLLANHVTWIDGMLIAASSAREVRFVAYEGFFKEGFIGWVLRLFGVIPISSKNARQAIKTTADAIKGGSLVCIFPEGELTRTGFLNEFQKGFELIARQSGDTPVIPVSIDGMWGSVFSFSENKFFRKRPRKFPYPATVSFGEPLTSKEAKRAVVRESLVRLRSEAFTQRPEHQITLAEACLKALKRRGRQVCLVDRSEVRRTRFTRKMVLASSIQLAERWRKTIAEDRVALALPPSSPSVFAHLGLILAGKTVINLPLQASDKQTLASAIKEAGVSTVITTKAIHEGLGDMPWPENVLSLTEELRAVDGLPRIKARLRVALSPSWLLRRQLKLTESLDRPPLAVLGVDGRYHFLRHEQILTQVAQIGAVNAFHDADVLLNLYPNHQVTGQVFGLWLPILQGLRFVVHTMGSHPASPDSLINKEEVTAIISDKTGLVFCEEAFKLEGHVVRMLATFDPLDAREEEPVVCRGWLSKPEGLIISLSVPHPLSEDVEQTGHVPGAVGKVLPATIVGSSGTEEEAAMLTGAEGGPLGGLGHIDVEGYLYVEEKA